MAKDKFEKCKSCANYNSKASNANWTVCKYMPVSVMVARTSKDCEKYEEIKNGPR